MSNNLDATTSSAHGSWLVTLLGDLHHRAVDLKSLPRWLQILCWLAIGQLVLVGILVSLHALSQPQIVVDTQPTGAVQVPILVFVVSLLVLVLGWSVLLAAAFHSYWPLRLLALGAFTFVFGGKPVVGLITQYTQLDPSLQFLAWLQASLIGLVWGVGLGIWLRDVLGRSKRPSPEVLGFPWRSVLFIMMILLAYYVTAAWYAFVVGSHQYVAFFPKMVTAPLGLASFLLILLPFIAATDYADLGARMSEQAARLLRRTGSVWPLFIMTTIMALGVVTRVLIETRPGGPHGASLSLGDYVAGLFVVLLFGAVMAVLAAGLLFLLMRIGRIQQWPDFEVPRTALIVATVFVALGGIFTVLAGPAALVVITLGGSLVVGVVVLVRGRRRVTKFAVVGLFLVMFAVFSLTGNVIHMIVGPATLVVLLYLALRRRINKETMPFVALLFALNGGLLVISWVAAAYGSPQYQTATTLAQGFTPIQAVLIAGALLWSFAMSGTLSFNVDGRRTRREMRILLNVGYIVLASTSAMYFAAETSTSSTALPSSLQESSDSIALMGIAILGIPFLLTSFALGVSRWRGEHRQAASTVQPQMDTLISPSDRFLNQADAADGGPPETNGASSRDFDIGTELAFPNEPPTIRRLVLKYGIIGGAILAALNLLSIAYPAAEVTLHHGTTSSSISSDFAALSLLIFLVSTITYWNVGRATAYTFNRVGSGVLAALLCGGLSWATYVVGNTLIAINQQHPFVGVALTGTTGIVAVVAEALWAVILFLDTACTAALAGYLGALSGRKSAMGARGSSRKRN